MTPEDELADNFNDFLSLKEIHTQDLYNLNKMCLTLTSIPNCL